MTKKTLLKVSALADVSDFITISVPGPWSLVTEVPAIICHFLYAGPKAIFVLTELIPGIGVVPIFTIAAMCYDKETGVVTPPPVPNNGEPVIIDAEVVTPRNGQTTMQRGGL